MRASIRDDGDADVLRRIQPFVCVGGPAMRMFDPGQFFAVSLTRARPQPEGAVDMHPGPGRTGDRYQVSERSEEHTSELQSLMRISYDVFCLKKIKQTKSKVQHKKDGERRGEEISNHK